MRKRVYRYRLRHQAKRNIVKVLITLAMIVLDCVLYHYLGVIGAYVGETSWASTFCFVGWFWLLAGQFMAFYMMWEI